MSYLRTGMPYVVGDRPRTVVVDNVVISFCKPNIIPIPVIDTRAGFLTRVPAKTRGQP